MITKNIVDVLQLESGTPDDPHWCILYEDAVTNVRWTICFNLSVFAARSAEYGIDYTDFQTLADIVIHETQFQLQDDDPTHLYNTDEETARINHLARVQKSKSIVTFADPNSLMNKLKQAHLNSFNVDRHSQHRKNVASLRAQRQRGKV